MKLSIIATLSNQSAYLEEFYTRLSTAAWILVGDDYELIMVCEMPSKPPDAANALASEDSHLRMLAMPGSREQGILEAMRVTCGESIFLIDVKPGEEPEWLLAFSAALEESDSDLIYAVNEKRSWTWLRSILAFFPFGKFLDRKLSLTSALMTRRLADAVLAANKPELIAGLPVELPDFRQTPFTVIVNHPDNAAW